VKKWIDNRITAQQIWCLINRHDCQTSAIAHVQLFADQ